MKSTEKKAFGITASCLKIIAIVSMFIDHVGAVILQPYLNAKIDTIDYDFSQILNKIYAVSRSVGRIAFPIFAFMLVEGFFHTKNRLKYLIRLAVFAVISEIPFDLAITGTAFSWNKQNVLVTLTLSFIMLIILDYIRNKEISEKYMSLFTVLVIAAFAVIGYYCKSDYDFKGILMVAGVYLLYPIFNTYRFTFCLCSGLMYCWEWNKTIRNFPASLSPLILCFYNGEKGRSLKYFFYIFYPLHLILLYYISRYLILYH